jgi:hypothetical protein
MMLPRSSAWSQRRSAVPLPSYREHRAHLGDGVRCAATGSSSPGPCTPASTGAGYAPEHRAIGIAFHHQIAAIIIKPRHSAGPGQLPQPPGQIIKQAHPRLPRWCRQRKAVFSCVCKARAAPELSIAYP